MSDRLQLKGCKLVCGDASIRLGYGIQTRIIQLLLRKPRTMQELILAVYDLEEPKRPNDTIRVHLSKTRVRLAEVGWTISLLTGGPKFIDARYELEPLEESDV